MTIEEFIDSVSYESCDNIRKVWHDEENSVFLEFHSVSRTVTIKCEGVAEYMVTPQWGVEYLEIESDHPLLWQWNDADSLMYYHGSSADPFKTYGKLIEMHVRLLGDWRPVSAYLSVNPSNLVQGKGKFASGPKRVLDQYADVVKDELQVHTIKEFYPGRTFSVLLLSQKQYVICEKLAVLD